METFWQSKERKHNISSYDVKLDRELTLTDIGILLREAIIELKEIRQIQEDAWKLDGTTMTNFFFIPQGWPVVKVNFLALGGTGAEVHLNTPRNTSFEVPGVPVQQLRLTNLGPAQLFYSTNKFMNQLEASDPLLTGETIEITTPKRSIKQINLATQGQGGCQVRLRILM